MTFEDAVHYTDESLKHCKEILSFLKRKQFSTLDYVKGLSKMRQQSAKLTTNTTSQLDLKQVESTHIRRVFQELNEGVTSIMEVQVWTDVSLSLHYSTLPLIFSTLSLSLSSTLSLPSNLISTHLSSLSINPWIEYFHLDRKLCLVKWQITWLITLHSSLESLKQQENLYLLRQFIHISPDIRVRIRISITVKTYKKHSIVWKRYG